MDAKEILLKLIEIKSKDNPSDLGQKQDLLLIYTMKNTPDLVMKLIKAKINLNETDSEGKTGLYWAIHFKQEINALALVKADARLQNIEPMGMSALYWAIRFKLSEVALEIIKVSSLANLNEIGSDKTARDFALGK